MDYFFNLGILLFYLINIFNIYITETVNINEISGKSLTRNAKKQEPNDHNVLNDHSITESIKDIAYYLREYKFNEWDRRYHQEKPDQNLIGFFGMFPTPSLKALHWEVKLNCHNDFYKCINYLHSVIDSDSNLRVDNTPDALNKKLGLRNSITIKQLNREYKDRHNYEEKMGIPFDEPVEKFQWRTTAAYYMCWYTMLGIPELSMIGEHCDNYANCLNSDCSSHNLDPRADDKLSFNCARYSFCPDLCCPIKHIDSVITCNNDNRNPCYAENTDFNSHHRKCHMDHKTNQNFKDIVNNRWNLTCNCINGFQWKSNFGMCVDINECLLGMSGCDNTSENCINLPGSYCCVCKFEFELDVQNNECLQKNFSVLKL